MDPCFSFESHHRYACRWIGDNSPVFFPRNGGARYMLHKGDITASRLSSYARKDRFIRAEPIAYPSRR